MQRYVRTRRTERHARPDVPCIQEAEGAEVTVPVKLLTEGLDHIKGLKERLAEVRQGLADVLDVGIVDTHSTQAQESYKPSVAKRLNEKITKLEREIAELRNRNKVNELEKKVQVHQGAAPLASACPARPFMPCICVCSGWSRS
jgi:hypothetical protein